MGTIADRIQRMATNAIAKAIPTSLLAKKSLPELVLMQRALMATAAGLPRSSQEKAKRFVRKQLLEDNGIPGDIRDMLKKGKTAGEVKAYYWECEEFRDFWHELECEEGMVGIMIQEAERRVHGAV